MPLLEPMPRQTLAQSCADHLRSAILTGELPVGRRLPAEHDLADQLDVSRLTLRSALIRLAGEGLVEARHGSGYWIRDFSSSAGSALLPSIVEVARAQGGELSVVTDLLRVRRHLAAALFERLLAAPPSAHHVDGVRHAIEAFGQAYADGAGPMELAEADGDVLAAILVASGSVVLQLSLHPIREVLQASPRLCAAMYRDPESNVQGWRAFLAWLDAPSPTPGPLVELLAARDEATLAAFRGAS